MQNQVPVAVEEFKSPHEVDIEIKAKYVPIEFQFQAYETAVSLARTLCRTPRNS